MVLGIRQGQRRFPRPAVDQPSLNAEVFAQPLRWPKRLKAISEPVTVAPGSLKRFSFRFARWL
jgi:hypothetical protein